jgi:pimeloyl-ACP methyl ester carboxylesterase
MRGESESAIATKKSGIRILKMRQTYRLHDGRLLAYALYGAASASQRTVIYHHGWPSSCSEGMIWSEEATKMDISLIAVDRPGIGGSTFHHGMRLYV